MHLDEKLRHRAEAELKRTGGTVHSEKFTMLDHFAGMAMQGICSNDVEDLTKDLTPGLAAVCYDIAEAMIAERSNRDRA